MASKKFGVFPVEVSTQISKYRTWEAWKALADNIPRKDIVRDRSNTVLVPQRQA